MMPQVSFEFRLDAYSPDTIPMERLAQYLLELSRLMGETQSVHFDKLIAGSTRAVARANWEAAPKIKKRVAEARANEGPEEARRARRRIDEMLVEDGSSGELADVSGEARKRLIYFPGAKRSSDLSYGPLQQQATLDGIPIVIGGEGDPVPVHLEDGHRVYNCLAARSVAKDIAAYLFQAPIRVTGVGTWFREADGEWQMRRFRIQAFRPLKDESVGEAVRRIQGLGTSLRSHADPIAELLAITHSGDDE
ncbi:MAG: hypothetical protein IT184_16455 [Acidobacteria bacterium]|nr:hypothetical protein [Acidobacteriota bacterium]